MTNEQKNYTRPDPKFWQGRADARDNEYIFNTIECLPIDQLDQLDQLDQHPPGLALLGFQSDIGVTRNGGRAGAKEGPNALRRQLAKLPLHRKLTLYDVGDIVCKDDDLESAQHALGQVVSQLLNLNYHPMVIGGGHETAFGHYLGIHNAIDPKKCAIVNFDAHFDLRDHPNSTSGTPFKQIADHSSAFDYTVIGIQPSANSDTLFQTADSLGVHAVLADDIHRGYRLDDTMTSIIERSDYIYMTICLDVFAAHIAPGVSAPQAAGLYLSHILPAMLTLIKSGKVISFDVVELAPPYDYDDHTAKLAAYMIWEFMHHNV